MKNSTKLILANIFALVTVVSIYSVAMFWSLDLSSVSGPVFPKVLLMLLPQSGFIYLYWCLSKTKLQKVPA